MVGIAVGRHDQGSVGDHNKTLLSTDPKIRFRYQIAMADQRGPSNDSGMSIAVVSVPSTAKVTVTQEENTPGVTTITLLPTTTTTRPVIAVVPRALTQIAPETPTVMALRRLLRPDLWHVQMNIRDPMTVRYKLRTVLDSRHMWVMRAECGIVNSRLTNVDLVSRLTSHQLGELNSVTKNARHRDASGHDPYDVTRREIDK
ncbi:hypothetical protein Sjap_007108 [Stephania japonica]|uniref:Uncharacterized protein n=1 Tax=Stephania japonica TaxID=461633 RepID=A0AAP0JMB3_9MAGN